MADAADFLPPTFQILTGLTFLAILVIRFFAGAALRPLWGKLVAFGVLFVALGHLLVSFATQKPGLSGAAEFLTYAGISYFAAAILVVVGLIIAARSATGAQS